MEPSLIVVGLNYRTAPIDVRERFWMNENGRREALSQLSQAEGIDEVVVLCTQSRTEFWLWASDVTLAANSVMRLLGAKYGLQLREWNHFYHLLDEASLLHIFCVASGLDSPLVDEPHVAEQVKEAWQQAQKLGTTGRFLDVVVEKALDVSDRLRGRSAIAGATLGDTASERKIDQRKAAAEAHKILQAEAQGFRYKLMAEHAVPTIVALRQRLDEFCRQELEAFRNENGPFSRDQDEMLHAILSRTTQRIAGSLARELKELPEKVEQEQMMTALQRLFHLPIAEQAIADTKSA